MAVYFDKSITLAEKMREYDNVSLRGFGADLGLRKLSKLNKSQLVEQIVEKLLDQETMFYRCAILSDQEIATFEKGMNGGYEYSDDEADHVGLLNEMDLAIVSRGQMIIPMDVVEAWKKVNDEKFGEYRRKASWIWKCLFWVETMYAIAPDDVVCEVINSKKGFRITVEELREYYLHFPDDQLWTYNIQDMYISQIYIDNQEALYNLRVQQSNKEFYIPTANEVNELFDTGALLSDKAYQDMLAFLKKEMKMDALEARYLLEDLWDKLASGADPHDTMQDFWNEFEFKNDKQVEKIVPLYMALTNNTRMLVNRGHKPTELLAKEKFGPENMPTITAGSSMAAEMLQQIAPEIQQMGFGLDLESNAGKVMTTQFPNGLNGQPIVAEKKVYPNDPCPCGSGKKYKKCCARK